MTVAPLPRAAYDPQRPSVTKPRQLAYPTAPPGSVYGGLDAPRMCPIFFEGGETPQYYFLIITGRKKN